MHSYARLIQMVQSQVPVANNAKIQTIKKPSHHLAFLLFENNVY
jgi:hypothetical protein